MERFIKRASFNDQKKMFLHVEPFDFTVPEDIRDGQANVPVETEMPMNSRS
jgi:hypothetical protein